MNYWRGPAAFIAVVIIILSVVIPRAQAAATLPDYNHAAVCPAARAWPAPNAPCRAQLAVQLARPWSEWVSAGRGGSTRYWLDLVTADGSPQTVRVSQDIWQRAGTTDRADIEIWHGQVTRWNLAGTIEETDASPPGSLRFLILAGLVALAVVLALALFVSLLQGRGFWPARDPDTLAGF